MTFVSTLPTLGRNAALQASSLPLTISRSASRLSGIHQGLRRTERSGFGGKREIRQKPEDEPYLTPEERQRARAIARRSPVEYKIRKGKKDITEESGPSRKSRAARFNDPRDPYGSHSIVKKLKSGELLQKAREKLNSGDGIMSPQDFELQMKLEQAEELMKGPRRGQHEKPETFDKRTMKYSGSRDDPFDALQPAPRAGSQSRYKEKDSWGSQARYGAKPDAPKRFSRGSRYDTRDFDEPRSRTAAFSGSKAGRFESSDRSQRYGSRNDWRDVSSGLKEDRFESSGRSQRYHDEPRDDVRSYRSEDNGREPDRRHNNEREEKEPEEVETEEADAEDTLADGNVKIRRTKTWEPAVVVPYTTAASQFLYGTSAVEAAIHANRRKLYKLYIYVGTNRKNKEQDDKMAELALRKQIPIEYVDETSLPLLNKMSQSRAHNGYVLEASPLPQTPVKALGEVPSDNLTPGFSIVLGHQSREEASINGSPDFIITEPSSRKPFVLLLDQILDPGNLGAVIRTASYMGVTAIVCSKRGSAPVTPTVLKASAGAAETLTMMSTESVVDFIEASKEKGWKVYAACPPKAEPGKRQVDTYDVESNDPLGEDPCILVLGNEGEGLTRTVRRAADLEVSIPNMGGSKEVDSLNVSVAAGLLCQAFLRSKTSELLMQKGSDKAAAEF